LSIQRFSPHKLAFQRRVASGLGVALIGLASGAAEARSSPLPERTRSQISVQIKTLLRDLGDLKEYLHEVKDDDTLVVKTFQGHPGCATLPRPTLLGEALDEARFAQVLRALEVINKALLSGVQPVVEGRQAACLAGLSPGVRLPEKSPGEITAGLSEMLRRVADLSLYLVSANRRGAIVVKTFTHPHACPTLPAPMAANTAVPKDLLGRAQNALDSVNQRRIANLPTTLQGRPAPCLKVTK
jgi:hypothetical protein